MSCKRGTFTPKVTGDNGVSLCCPPIGGTKTVGSPAYVLTVRNPPGTLPAECFIILEDEEVPGNVVPLTEDNGELICIDEI
jgi:hypothetical protein